MSGKGLHTLLLPDIPELGEGVTGTGNELVVVERVDAQAHDIAKMVGEFGHLCACLDIPQNAGHITRGCEDASIIDETAAAQISRMAGKLASDPSGTFSGRKIVNGADVIKTATSDEITAGRVCAGHDPG